ncbi:MAG: hypothetical protein JW882_12175 [Deltaproteobacteria bacterium]|nr:hypothetical protein [Deltaproteobacteria bacterium]
MKLRTTAETISFLKSLEDQSAGFYEDMVDRYSKDEDLLLSCAKENKSFVDQIQRAYYSVISDALEGCFSFDLEMDDYVLETDFSGEASYKDALNQVIRMEEKILDFYETAADQSMSLMADVPRNLKLVAKKRKKRIPKLQALF